MKINKMNASARKFIARRRLSNNGKFTQKILKNEIIPSVIEEPTLEKNYYFSTSAGGKNVLSTNKTTTDTQNILTICNTVILSQITPVARTILNLCDGSVIKALNGSKNLDINTDPALHCINDQFNAQCKTTSSSSLNDFLEIFLPIIFFAGCCYAIKKCCCTPPTPETSSNLSQNSNSLLVEQHRYYQRLNAERTANDLARLCCSIQ